MSDEKFKIVSVNVGGLANAKTVARKLIEHSQWFRFSPLPDDVYVFEVRDTNEELLKSLVPPAEKYFVVLLSSEDTLSSVMAHEEATYHLVDAFGGNDAIRMAAAARWKRRQTEFAKDGRHSADAVHLLDDEVVYRAVVLHIPTLTVVYEG